MPKVIADITMSLDGYVTGPGADEQHGLGDAPELHTWVTEQDAVDTEILEGATAQSGVVVMGAALRRHRRPWGLERGHGVRRGSDGRAAVLRRHPRAAAGRSA